eukprot:1183764-Prorocentrum_minimum.AAC.1
MDVKGCGVDVKGCHMDVKGCGVDVKDTVTCTWAREGAVSSAFRRMASCVSFIWMLRAVVWMLRAVVWMLRIL